MRSLGRFPFRWAIPKIWGIPLGRKNSRHLSKMIMIYDDKLIYYDDVYDYNHLINHKLRQKSLMLSPSLLKHFINHAFLLGFTHHERTLFQKRQSLQKLPIWTGNGMNIWICWWFFWDKLHFGDFFFVPNFSKKSPRSMSCLFRLLSIESGKTFAQWASHRLP